jgi:hypothetical protein
MTIFDQKSAIIGQLKSEARDVMPKREAKAFDRFLKRIDPRQARLPLGRLR